MKKALVLAALLVLAGCSSGAEAENVTVTDAPVETVVNPTDEAPVGCVKTRDALDTAAIAYYVDNLAYPTSFGAMTPYIKLRDRVQLVETLAGDEIDGPGWTLQMTGGGDSPPTFVCIDT